MKMSEADIPQLRHQRAEQGFGLLQIERVGAFGEPAVDRSEKIARLFPPIPIKPKLSKVPCGAKLERAGVLTPRNH